MIEVMFCRGRGLQSLCVVVFADQLSIDCPVSVRRLEDWSNSPRLSGWLRLIMPQLFGRRATQQMIYSLTSNCSKKSRVPPSSPILFTQN